MANITLELTAAPELSALMQRLIDALASEKHASEEAPLPQTPEELAARQRVAQLPFPAPAPQPPAPPTYPMAPQQYRPQPGPAPATPYAPVVPTAPPAVPTPAPRPVAPVAAAPTAPMPAGPSTAPQAAYPSNPAPVAAAPAYSIDDLARAAAQLMDAGKQQQLIALLGQFGIQSLGALPKERFGEFATALRQMGARI